jgi:formylglycine-generating enzyme required for sulfatase activity
MKEKKFKCALLMMMLCIPFQSIAFEKIINSINMSFIKIPPGKFNMGLKDRDEALLEIPEVKKDALMDELPSHEVSIVDSFFMGETEVTQQQWLNVMENKPGDESLWKVKNWEVLPVSSVSWVMAARFIKELNELDDIYHYRFPTEAEWEYVARSKSDELRPNDEEVLGQYAWYIDSSGDKVQPVATKKPNAFGVYDMLGNLWEWVGDWYGADVYKHENRRNPQGPETGWSRVRRGGSYHCPIHLIRPGYRSANKPETRYEVTGFRVVAEAKK